MIVIILVARFVSVHWEDNGSVLTVGCIYALYICSYCQERLVVSQSGHYIRDPFAIVGVESGRLLRCQSRPIAWLRHAARTDDAELGCFSHFLCCP
ncbi:MAG: hypothetical protein GDA43_23310 [Hormoscilla sp. SP5CHS1]|nr:hypothetical protein [Hormoscilla sp. SP12CHS1]MBC6455745.1 hypothetical protein [Hormoscilla sp. SP5CHS1]